MKDNIEKKIFPDQETFHKIYDECLNAIPIATEEVKSSYAGMGSMFDEYVNAVEKWVFRHAYQRGYEAAMAEMRRGGVV